MDLSRLDMISRGANIEDLLHEMEQQGCEPLLVECLRRARQNEVVEYDLTPEQMAEKLEKQTDTIELLYQPIVSWADTELGPMIIQLVNDIVEAKGGKRKTKEALATLVDSIENSSLGADSIELISGLTSHLQQHI